MEDIKNILSEGMIIKNYKEMCLILKEKVKTGESKQIQLKNWSRYFTFTKYGQSFVIAKIFDIPLNKTNNSGKSEGSRGNHYIPIKDKCFLISEEDSLKRGVYVIQLSNSVYVGSTCVNFKERYKQHKRNYDGTMSHTQEVLLSGATFSTLWIADDSATDLEIRMKEQYYIDFYNKDENYNSLNRRNEITPIRSKKKNIKANNKTKKVKCVNMKVNSASADAAIELLKQAGIDFSIGKR